MSEDTNCSIYLMPFKKNISIHKGCMLINALIEAGIHIESPCGGKGTCGKCSVMVSTQNNGEFTKELACKYAVYSDITVNIPQGFISDNRKKLMAVKHIVTPGKSRIQKNYLGIMPQKTNSLSDQEVIGEELKKINIRYPEELEVLRKIPDILRKADYNITVVSSMGNVIGIEKGNTVKYAYGVAFDIGTTTIVGTLMNLVNGEALASESCDNPQRVYGADVIARIAYIGSSKKGLSKLHEILINSVNGIIDILSVKCNINKNYIYALSFVGNTTMMHIFLKINPSNLAANPYLPVYKFPGGYYSRDLGIKINSAGECIVAPNIAGFVGADTVAAVLATDFIESKKIKLLIDIGTNCEIVLGSKEKGFYACSAAAGPAFEGAEIKFGMRAVKGTIEGVEITDDVHIKTIGDIAPIGICGSGLIDAVSELLRCNIINKKGSFNDKSDLLQEKIINRIVRINGEKCFILSFKDDNDIGEDIVITQKDIRQVQLAKGAILAGIRILQSILDTQDQEISEIQLAGAFGSYIKKESICRLGMLPEVDLNKITAVGNAAGIGSQKILLSNKYYEDSIDISRNISYIELSTSQVFIKEFLKALNFPDR